MAVTMIDRRMAPREWMEAPLDVLGPHPGSGSVLDISSTGLRAAMNRHLHVGQRCLLRIFSKRNGEAFRWVRVVWSERTANGCLVGMQFG